MSVDRIATPDADSRTSSMSKASAPRTAAAMMRSVRFAGRMVPACLALTLLTLVVAVGIRTNWRPPKFSTLVSKETLVSDDWCAEHGVPESQCVECVEGCLPRGPEFGWCKTHGVAECPLCHPEVAQLYVPYSVSDEDRNRALRTIDFAPRTENNSKCKSHARRLQIATDAIVEQLGIEIVPVNQAHIVETISADGEITFDPTRIIRVGSRAAGILWKVLHQPGEAVKKGEVLALVDSADVGKAKAILQQSLFDVWSKRQSLEKVRNISGEVVAPKRVFEAQAQLEEAEVRLFAAQQALINLGLPVDLDSLNNGEPSQVATAMQFLGIPHEMVRTMAPATLSSNLLPIVASQDGIILSRTGTAGESIDGSQVLFVVADTSRVWLTLNVRLEDIERVRPGQLVHFFHQGHDASDEGTVKWISPAADEKTRTVPVRVELNNVDSRHHAHDFGSARIVLREETKAMVVPTESVHWDGDCNVVFVRDRDFDESSAHKVFHVRKVRPAAQDVIGEVAVTEIAVGLVPGELIAATNSGILRSELLKNNLGAG